MSVKNKVLSMVLLAVLAASYAVQAQHPLLQSGPMLGYVDMKEVQLWAQTKAPAAVSFEYWEEGNPAQRYRTNVVQTLRENGYTAKCMADQVEPGRHYAYRLLIDNSPVVVPYPTVFKTQTLWQWRTDPPEFSIAAGSCFYVNETEYDRPGKPYGSDYHILNALHAQRPDMMIWLGDNSYLREVDWFTRTGMLHRYTHTRSLPELQPLLASTSHVAIWDDHDFGPNDSDGTWVHKDMAWDVFRNFWCNPTFGVNGQKGCTSYLQYGDVDIFMLDNRYFRTPNHCESCPRTMLGKEQLDWFLAALAESRAPFKLVAIGGQVLSTNKSWEIYGNVFPAERDSILAHIEREQIKGVVFLSGDVHFTEFSAMKNGAGNMVHELTCSSLTAGSNTRAKETVNAHRVDGTVVDRHNFAMLRFSGPRQDRQLEISIYDADGNVSWTRTIKASEL